MDWQPAGRSERRRFGIRSLRGLHFDDIARKRHRIQRRRDLVEPLEGGAQQYKPGYEKQRQTGAHKQCRRDKSAGPAGSALE